MGWSFQNNALNFYTSCGYFSASLPLEVCLLQAYRMHTQHPTNPFHRPVLIFAWWYMLCKGINYCVKQELNYALQPSQGTIAIFPLRQHSSSAPVLTGGNRNFINSVYIKWHKLMSDRITTLLSLFLGKYFNKLLVLTIWIRFWNQCSWEILQHLGIIHNEIYLLQAKSWVVTPAQNMEWGS